MRRQQVKAPSKEWTDAGPDLLRRDVSAIDAVAKLVPRGELEGRVLRAGQGGAAWKPIGRRRAARRWLRDALESSHDGDRVQVGVRKWDEVEVRAVVRTKAIDVEPLGEASVSVELVNALFAAAFPASLFAGAFVCKETSPGYWSDHGWGDAGDRTSSANAPNDQMTDWLRRMAAAGDVPLDRGYLLGSRDGKVVKSRKLYGWRLVGSDADPSHLWHVHYSVVDHGGARPPCA